MKCIITLKNLFHKLGCKFTVLYRGVATFRFPLLLLTLLNKGGGVVVIGRSEGGGMSATG
jgi:hypothetical protein